MSLPLWSNPPLVQLVRRRRFCLLDRLMRQGSTNKGTGQQGGYSGVSILINPVQIYQFNKPNQALICLFMSVHMHAICYLYICAQTVWERAREGELWLGTTQLDWFKVIYSFKACIWKCALHVKSPENRFPVWYILMRHQSKPSCIICVSWW